MLKVRPVDSLSSPLLICKMTLTTKALQYALRQHKASLSSYIKHIIYKHGYNGDKLAWKASVNKHLSKFKSNPF